MYDQPAGASMYDDPSGGGGGSMYDQPAGGTMYDQPAPEEAGGFDFAKGDAAADPAPAPAPPPALVGPEPTLAAPPSTGDLESDLATMKSHISDLVASQVEALQQSATLRSKVDTLKTEIVETEAAVADAGAAEEYEKAEELQAAVEAKQAELSQSQAALKQYTERYDKAEESKEAAINQQIEAREQAVQTLRQHRESQEASCAEFVGGNGPKLQAEETDCNAKSDEIDAAKQSVVDGNKKAAEDFAATEAQVASNTAGPTAEKQAEDARLVTLNAKVDDLTRQLQEATAERDASQAKVAEIASVIDKERENFKPKYAEIEQEKQRLAAVDKQADSDRAVVEGRQKALEEQWAAAEESRAKLVAAIQGIADQEDEHLDAIDLIKHNLRVDKDMAKKQADRERTLDAPEAELVRLKKELEEFNTANASYTAEMAGLDGQIGSLQAAVDTLGQKIPTLEGEKKAAAAARNFKEAGRLSKEIAAAGAEKEEKEKELGAQKAAKAQKEADNSEAAAKLVQLEGAVGNQEKTVGSTQFDGTRSSF